MANLDNVYVGMEFERDGKALVVRKVLDHKIEEFNPINGNNTTIHSWWVQTDEGNYAL